MKLALTVLILLMAPLMLGWALLRMVAAFLLLLALSLLDVWTNVR